MSSTYRILCLSHDPAIAVGYDGFSSPGAVEEAIARGVNEHEQCDLLIGRYSYPLVEVGCPGRAHEPAGQRLCGSYHPRTTEWIDVAWLRLLAVAQEVDDERLRAMLSEARPRHWPPERVRRLRVELAIELTEERP